MTAAWIRERQPWRAPRPRRRWRRQHRQRHSRAPVLDERDVVQHRVEHRPACTRQPAGRPQVAGDHVGVMRLPQAGQDPPARPHGDLLGPSELGHQGGHVAPPTSCCRRRARPPPSPSSGAAAPCGSGRGAPPGRSPASMPTISISALVAALSETASIRRSRSARVSAVAGSHALDEAPPPGAGASPARSRRPRRSRRARPRTRAPPRSAP